jgi:glucosyl-dolichyl phosphate glucuronosyltransferase
MGTGQPCAVSVIISTYNRCSLLAGALDAARAQTGGVPYEVIIVDNNSTDGTREFVSSRLSSFPHLRYIFEKNQGLPHARNAGVLAARAPILAFTDDDVKVGPDWVLRIKQAFDANPDIDMLGGRVIPTWPSKVPDWVTRQQVAPFALGERGDAPIRVSAANAAPCLVGANFAFRRAVFDRIGLFDPAYVKSQDREIQMRLWRAGGVGLYEPALAIQVEIPAERLTKKYFRHWYSTYGAYHSRMRLLDSIDRNGRLKDPGADAVRLFGVPAYLYREFVTSVARGLGALARFRTAAAFYWENRSRYLFTYIRERIRENAAVRTHSVLAEIWRFAGARWTKHGLAVETNGE